MSSLVDHLINDNLIPLKPYESARRLYAGGQDWLNANESPFANHYDVDSSHFNRYPSCQPDGVINGYSAYARVAKSQLMVTRGADEGIELLIRTFCTPGKDSILICPPTYGMYAISAETCDIGVKKVPLKSDFNLDVEGICSNDDVNVVFICAPNNPTGTQVAKQDLDNVLRHFTDKALVVVDEAYIDFGGESAITLIDKYPNLLVSQTLSKARSLAGLRVGFAVGHPDLIEALNRVKNSFNSYPLDRLALAGAKAAYEDEAWFRKCCDGVISERERVTAALEGLGFEVLPSKANFIFARHKDQPGEVLAKSLREQGIIVRHFNKPRISEFLRITIGTVEQNDALIAGLESL